ncbi:MAG: hypothetical protein HC876_03615 [Chloroflexaceae bacterium]|nr:hypothetical protein [Chloroflexaceae bacterium]
MVYRLELGSDGTGASSENDTPDPSQSESASGGGFTRSDGSEQDAASVEASEDPLYIPPDMRDVVQEYFSP